MENKIKSGRDVVHEFFAEILNVPNTDKTTVDMLVTLYSQGKLTDKNIQNALDDMIQKELKAINEEK